MSRDYDPQPGQWYEDLERDDLFLVLSVDPDEEIVRLQWLEGEVEQIYLDHWIEMDVELAEEPEGWVDDEDGEWAENDDDEDDEEEDEEDDDWDDDYDEYRDRE